MNFTLQQLIIFHNLVETRSVTMTAERLHLTQPAVSIQLKNFQKTFDQQLFETIGKRIYITAFGKEIDEKIQHLIHNADDINQLTKSQSGQLQGPLKMAVVSTGKYVMPYFLSEFLSHHPMVELKMDVSNKQQVIQSLKNNEVDFALVSIMPSDLQLNKIDLIDNKLYMVGQSKKNQNERPKKISDCSPLIYREKGSGTRQTMEKFIERKKIQPIKPIELTSNEAIKQAILSGMGYSIMPIIGIKNELNNGQLEIISIPGLPIRTVWRLVWLSEKKLSVIAEQYLKHVKSNRNQIISKHFSWLE